MPPGSITHELPNISTSRPSTASTPARFDASTQTPFSDARVRSSARNISSRKPYETTGMNTASAPASTSVRQASGKERS